MCIRDSDKRLPEVLQKVKDLGSLTFVDPVTPYMREWSFLFPAMKWIDIFHCNMHEVKQITGKENPREAGNVLINKGIGLAVISLGDRGLIAVMRRRVIEMPAFKVPVIDPTGAGDALCAGIIAGLLQETAYNQYDLRNLSIEDLIEILLIGEAAGAACVTMVGTTTAVTRENTERILEEQGEELRRNVKVSSV